MTTGGPGRAGSAGGDGVRDEAPSGGSVGRAAARVARVAVIDLGTVTCRLLVADVGPAGVIPVSRSYDVCQMGEGVALTGRLTVAALGRVERAVASYRETLDGLARSGMPVERIAVLATSAARDAENSSALVALLARYGFALDVIPGELEARLSFSGATSAALSGRGASGGVRVHEAAADILTSDVGGGSTELVAGDAPAGGEPVIRAAKSLDVGARRVTDLFLASNPPTSDELRHARAWTCETLAPFFDVLGHVPSALVATAGTITTLVCVRDGIDPYDEKEVMGARMTLDDLDELVCRLARIPISRRSKLAGLGAKRAGVIVGGAIVQREVLALSGLSSLTVSTAGLMEGAALWLGRSLATACDAPERIAGDGLPWDFGRGRTT